MVSAKGMIPNVRQSYGHALELYMYTVNAHYYWVSMFLEMSFFIYIKY